VIDEFTNKYLEVHLIIYISCLGNTKLHTAKTIFGNNKTGHCKTGDTDWAHSLISCYRAYGGGWFQKISQGISCDISNSNLCWQLCRVCKFLGLGVFLQIGIKNVTIAGFPSTWLWFSYQFMNRQYTFQLPGMHRCCPPLYYHIAKALWMVRSLHEVSLLRIINTIISRPERRWPSLPWKSSRHPPSPPVRLVGSWTCKSPCSKTRGLPQASVVKGCVALWAAKPAGREFNSQLDPGG
jgi:hypothetical protein